VGVQRKRFLGNGRGKKKSEKTALPWGTRGVGKKNSERDENGGFNGVGGENTPTKKKRRHHGKKKGGWKKTNTRKGPGKGASFTFKSLRPKTKGQTGFQDEATKRKDTIKSECLSLDFKPEAQTGAAGNVEKKK